MWAIKYGAGILPTRNSLVIRRHDSDTAWPWSNEDTETTEHIFQCPNQKMIKCFDDKLDKIRDFLAASTSLNTKNNIIQLIEGLRTGVFRDYDEEDSSAQVAKKQWELGMWATMNGMWLKKWIRLQEDYFKTIGNRKSWKLWIVNFELLQMAHKMWKTRNEDIHKKVKWIKNNIHIT